MAAAVLIAVLSWAAYTWTATAGTWTNWFPGKFSYYDSQANAFLHGQLALLEKPDPRLLALANPYSFWERHESIPYIWDSSLYQGRFYLYWGPAPALLAAGIKLLFPNVLVLDEALAVGFLCLFTLLISLLINIQRRIFAPSAPVWGTAGLILAGCLNLFGFYVAARPAVYEAAVLAGQVFFLAGLALVASELQKQEARTEVYLLVGCCWALALGSRISLLPGIAWLAVFFSLRLVWQGWKTAPGTTLCRLAALWLPLAVGLAGLGWYNQARFGSPFETGYRYQLSIPAFPPEQGWMYSTAYLAPNAFAYLLRPPDFIRRFPFVALPFIERKDWLAWIPVPDHYIYLEPLVGILWVLPSMVLTAAGVAPVLIVQGYQFIRKRARTVRGLGGWMAPASWWIAALAVYTLIQLGMVLGFFYSTMRYQFDWLAGLLLLASLCAWRMDRWLERKPTLRLLFWGGVMMCGLYSIAAGWFGSFSAIEQRFAANNPALYGWLEHEFNRLLPLK